MNQNGEFSIFQPPRSPFLRRHAQYHRTQNSIKIEKFQEEIIVSTAVFGFAFNGRLWKNLKKMEVGH